MRTACYYITLARSTIETPGRLLGLTLEMPVLSCFRRVRLHSLSLGYRMRHEIRTVPLGQPYVSPWLLPRFLQTTTINTARKLMRNPIDSLRMDARGGPCEPRGPMIVQLSFSIPPRRCTVCVTRARLVCSKKPPPAPLDLLLYPI